jgi:hypothetical protein
MDMGGVSEVTVLKRAETDYNSTIARLTSMTYSLQDDVLDCHWRPLPHRGSSHGWYSEKDFSTKELAETHRYDLLLTHAKM